MLFELVRSRQLAGDVQATKICPQICLDFTAFADPYDSPSGGVTVAKITKFDELTDSPIYRYDHAERRATHDLRIFHRVHIDTMTLDVASEHTRCRQHEFLKWQTAAINCACLVAEERPLRRRTAHPGSASRSSELQSCNSNWCWAAALRRDLHTCGSVPFSDDAVLTEF
ncbi:hypothetical protein [Gemmatimonas sp.]|uniref:hypothetical protein n=1 Tax=Gemmatimonas sp. TaxID=1962908 RepID=UPI0039839FA7